MSETTHQAKDQLPADIRVLHRQLEELSALVKPGNPTDQRRAVRGLVMEIRGK